MIQAIDKADEFLMALGVVPMQHGTLSGNEKGLTLVEVLATVVILGIAMTMFIGLSSYNRQADQRMEMEEHAMRLLENMLSDIHTGLDQQNGRATLETIQQKYNSEHQPYRFYMNPIQDVPNVCAHSTSLASLITLNHKWEFITITACWE